MPDLNIVIVNWNTRELLRECLKSVFAEPTGLVLEVLVVDNASTDGSAAMVQDAFPRVRLIESGGNLGFAKGNNLAFPLCTASTILLLNPDATLRANALCILLTFLAEHPEVAAVGPKLLHPRLQLSVLGCGNQPTLRRMFNHYFFLARLFPRIKAFEGLFYYIGVHDQAPRKVGWLAGTCLMVRREVVDQVGGLSERWFMYAEDVEWCARMRGAGWNICHVPEAIAEHHLGASTEQHSEGYVMGLRASRDLFVQINRPSRFELFLHDAILVSGLALRSLGYFLRSLFSTAQHAPMWRAKAHTYSVYSRAAAGLASGLRV
ncbi:MAG: glycosyltransferase family 2 protein [Chthoniobacterales bacterium]